MVLTQDSISTNILERTQNPNLGLCAIRKNVNEEDTSVLYMKGVFILVDPKSFKDSWKTLSNQIASSIRIPVANIFTTGLFISVPSTAFVSSRLKNSKPDHLSALHLSNQVIIKFQSVIFHPSVCRVAREP